MMNAKTLPILLWHFSWTFLLVYYLDVCFSLMYLIFDQWLGHSGMKKCQTAVITISLWQLTTCSEHLLSMGMVVNSFGFIYHICTFWLHFGDLVLWKNTNWKARKISFHWVVKKYMYQISHALAVEQWKENLAPVCNYIV